MSETRADPNLASMGAEVAQDVVRLVRAEIDLAKITGPIRLTLSDEPAAVDGPRVGVSQAADRPWRFWLAGRPEVSAYRRSPRAPAPGASD